ncbi:hypothetical protein OZ401_004885 (plasmid) [Candidatus Chlorohelix allophototropha]|uniref:Uncharacterized protein n=1 Tax=Candidatus Chlorohelix allophototropha TaxID=3003348 RepID=A0ABY9BAF3_9CHLR|nr:hypothetical protein OZ401_004885 [Chloroflexota bacterium L227-S17]
MSELGKIAALSEIGGLKTACNAWLLLRLRNRLDSSSILQLKAVIAAYRSLLEILVVKREWIKMIGKARKVRLNNLVENYLDR